MNARQYLYQVRNLDTRINAKIRELEKLRDNMSTIRSAGDINDIRVQSSGSQNKVEDLIIKIISCEHEINDMINDLIERKKEVVATIDMIDDTDIFDVIQKRYVQCLAWEKIADQKNMSEQWVFELHKRGLQVVQQILQKQSKTECSIIETE